MINSYYVGRGVVRSANKGKTFGVKVMTAPAVVTKREHNFMNADQAAKFRDSLIAKGHIKPINANNE